jgi:hypothetical protein
MDRLVGLWHGVSGPTADALARGTESMDMQALLAFAAALGWASGLRLYAVLFITGLSGMFGWIALPHSLQLLQHPAMLAASGAMLLVEFFTDKIPGLDSLWDLVHAVVRVPGGAALAAAVFGADNATMAVVAGLLGASLAATSYAGKVTTRAAVNTSPEPFSNVAVSLLEDGLVVGALWLAVQHPLVFAIALAFALVFTVLLLMVLFRFMRAIGRRLANWYKPSPAH